MGQKSQAGYERSIYSKKGLAICGAIVLILLSLGLIKNCHFLCCSSEEPEIAVPTIPDSRLEKGFLAALENAAQITHQQSRRNWTIWPFGKSTPRMGAIEDALTREALEARSTAYKQEKVAQEKIRAVLERREVKHKKVLQGLQEKGWHISLRDQAVVGSLEAACGELRAYFKSAAYREARLQRIHSSHGRGIAMSAGGLSNLANAYVTLHMVRKVHLSDLPIEIFFNGVEEFDLKTQNFFKEEFSGIALIDVSKHPLPPLMAAIPRPKGMLKQRDGWMTKAQMLYLTSFEEVLVLDSDNIPLRDLSFLFDTSEYKASGNLFWPDFWSNNFHNPGPAYSLLSLRNPWMADTSLSTTESGQYLINRRLHDDVLEWIVLLNLHGEEVYDMIWGDKDTYRLAFHLANKAAAFTQVAHRPANAMHAPDRELAPAKLELKPHGKSQDGAVRMIADLVNLQEQEIPKLYKHAGMVQMGPDGAMLFLHRTSDAKLNPQLEYPYAYEAVQYITPPLSPRQAASVHLDGQMDLLKFSPDRIERCQPAKGLYLTQIAIECGVLDTVSAETMPGDISSFFPIPLFSIDEFPSLSSQLQDAMRAFRYVQRLYLSRQLRFGSEEQIDKSEAPSLA